MSKLTSGPETWPWGPVGWWRSLHDRVSRVPACKSSPRAKLESDRYWWSLILGNGTPERPWPTTTSMCSKAAWFRAQNSVDSGSSDPPSEHQSPRGVRRNVELDRYTQPLMPGAKNMLICRTSSEPSRVPYAVLGRGLSAVHQPIADSSSRWGPNEVVVRGPRRTPLPSPLTTRKMVRKQRPRSITRSVRPCPSVRRPEWW